MWDATEEARRWLAQAENDVAFARLALSEDYFHQACFIAQQSAEKALKALGFALGERSMREHSIIKLVKQLRRRVPTLDDLREEAGSLDQYYIPTRYPDALAGGVPFEAFHRAQAEQAVASAEAFLKLARGEVSRRFPNAQA